MIKAIFWDNDGILVDTEPLYFQATREVLAHHNVVLTREEFIRISLQQGQSAFDLARDQGYDPAELEQMRRQRNRRYTRLLEEGAEALPHVEETLKALYGRFRMGIVTSSLAEHFNAIHSQTGLLPYFDFTLTREQYAQTKPHPEPYLTALLRCGLSPKECIVIEDSERGLAAAVAAGLRCIAIPTELTRGGDFSQAFAVLEDVSEISSLLSRI
ncbi:MAG: HAD family hydrolase [Geoalkalibacter sp.]|uniref:HAD family hydrolase n=1 Tax=Geoalkalibacter sp. TaxID=3041440 RepID=UPI003D0EE897